MNDDAQVKHHPSRWFSLPGFRDHYANFAPYDVGEDNLCGVLVLWGSDRVAHSSMPVEDARGLAKRLLGQGWHPMRDIDKEKAQMDYFKLVRLRWELHPGGTDDT